MEKMHLQSIVTYSYFKCAIWQCFLRGKHAGNTVFCSAIVLFL